MQPPRLSALAVGGRGHACRLPRSRCRPNTGPELQGQDDAEANDTKPKMRALGHDAVREIKTQAQDVPPPDTRRFLTRDRRSHDLRHDGYVVVFTGRRNRDRYGAVPGLSFGAASGFSFGAPAPLR